jgi:hypothetical protein
MARLENRVRHIEEETMATLHIEHVVPDFDAWKKAFDSDPLQRKKSGVLRYRVLRPVNDPKYAVVDLEFDTPAQAEAMLSRLKEMWSKVTVMREPQARILESVESREL